MILLRRWRGGSRLYRGSRIYWPSFSTSLLPIKTLSRLFKALPGGAETAFEGNRVRSMCSCAHFVVHWGIASVFKPDVESNDVM